MFDLWYSLASDYSSNKEYTVRCVQIMDTIVLQIIRQILVTSSHSSALLSISASGDSITPSCLVLWYTAHSTSWFLTLAIEQCFCHPSVPIHLPNMLSVLRSQLTSLQRRWTLRLCLCHSLPSTAVRNLGFDSWCHLFNYVAFFSL